MLTIEILDTTGGEPAKVASFQADEVSIRQTGLCLLIKDAANRRRAFGELAELDIEFHKGDGIGSAATITIDPMDTDYEFDVVAMTTAALEKIIANAPQTEPEEENYDNMESAYNNGHEVAWWEAAKIARDALRPSVND